MGERGEETSQAGARSRLKTKQESISIVFHLKVGSGGTTASTAPASGC